MIKKQADVVSRRRLWYWRHKFRVWFWLGLILVAVFGGIAYSHHESIFDAFNTIGDNIPNLLTQAVTRPQSVARELCYVAGHPSSRSFRAIVSTGG